MAALDGWTGYACLPRGLRDDDLGVCRPECRAQAGHPTRRALIELVGEHRGDPGPARRFEDDLSIEDLGVEAPRKQAADGSAASPELARQRDDRQSEPFGA